MPGQIISRAEYDALIGMEVGSSDWIMIDQLRIDGFADVTLDRQYIHVDPEAAQRSLFGGTIAHGFLTLSLLSAMAQQVLPTIEGSTAGINFGFDSLRFISPVRCGRRLRGRFVLKDVKERAAGVVQSNIGVTVEIEGEAKPALVAEWLTLAYF